MTLLAVVIMFFSKLEDHQTVVVTAKLVVI